MREIGFRIQIKGPTVALIVLSLSMLFPAVALPAADTVLAPGSEIRIAGRVQKIDDAGLAVREELGGEMTFSVTVNTVIKERKSNPFRAPRMYASNALLVGLPVEVKGHASSSGQLVADEVRFTDDDLRTARSIRDRVRPVEERLTGTEGRLSKAEENAMLLAGQVDEVSAASNEARRGAIAAGEAAAKAQGTADKAISGIGRTNDRIDSIDDFEVRQNLIINFKAGSAALPLEAKQEIEKFAREAAGMRGYLVEVAGFASSDGGENLNRMLSRRRADAVIQHLAENCGIPLRRITVPHGFGELQPVADNATRTGRAQNRRVELRLLVSKGLDHKSEQTASLH